MVPEMARAGGVVVIIEGALNIGGRVSLHKEVGFHSIAIGQDMADILNRQS